ncbi:hypothetical protein ACIQM4_34490 [Streptomyces sp. NPDC091272]|uniref:hypothetical protein n=1 Tax=Streptomyces sp. NPDC091272 TaxID=3365981 RepID=UPI00381DABB4
MSSTQEWPAARYLTAGGAHVDLTPVTELDDADVPQTVGMTALCTACTATVTEMDTHPYRRTGEREAHRWAQDHAAWCRRMARPAGATS